MQETLVDYGIETEQSDFRVHCCVKAKEAWFFPIHSGVLAMYGCEYVSAKTFEGYKVPLQRIAGAKLLKTEGVWWDVFGKDQYFEETSSKGSKAVELVKNILYHRSFPFYPDGWLEANEIDQIKGADLIIFGDRKIQVKCDWLGGSRMGGGSGNLFLQTKECNTHKNI